jgi:hypothetical protein
LAEYPDSPRRTTGQIAEFLFLRLEFLPLARAQQFFKGSEWPAAANYARTAIETSLKTICDKLHVPIPFRIEAEQHNTEEFLGALKDVKRTKRAKLLLLPKTLQSRLKALRKTVLNPLTHGSSTTVGRTEIDRALKVARKLVSIASKCRKRSGA